MLNTQQKLEREVYAHALEARLSVERALACVSLLIKEAGTKDAWQAQDRLTSAASILGNLMVAFDDNTVVELREKIRALEAELERLGEVIPE